MIPSPLTPNPVPAKSPKSHPKAQQMIIEVKELQRLLLDDARNLQLKPYIRAGLARAYVELAELRLRLQGKGPPKAVDYVDRRTKRRSPSSNGFTEVESVTQKHKAPKAEVSVNDNER